MKIKYFPIIAIFCCFYVTGCTTCKISFNPNHRSFKNKRIAVLDTSPSRESGLDWTIVLAGGIIDDTNRVAQPFENELMDLGIYKVIDRSSIDIILKEKKLTSSDIVDSGKAREIGKLAGVDGIVVTESAPFYVSWVGPILYADQMANAKLIDVSSGEILWSAHARYFGVSVVPIIPLWSDPAQNLAEAIVGKIEENIDPSFVSSNTQPLSEPVPKDDRQIKKIKKVSLPLETSRRHALIIGISQYQHAGKNKLKNLIYADDDAKAFANELKSLGWNNNHVKLLTNEQATKRNIEIALESWLTKAGPNDQIVLFWSGHGYPDPEDPEKVYFACYDTDINIPATGYRMDKVRMAIEEHKARNVIVLADTCHAGKLITRGDKGISIIPQIEKMRREQNIPKGWIFMVGADSDRLAIENSSWSNGAFTHCLINGLSGEADGFESIGPKDGVVTMGELRAYMNSAMPDETQKVLGVAKRPVITTSTGDPDIWNLTLEAK